MSGELEQKATELLTQTITQLQHATPAATKLALLAVQIEAAGYFLTAGAGIVMAVGAAVIWKKKFWPWAQERFETEPFTPLLAGGILVGVGGLGVIWASQLLNVWNYAALLHPDLWLARQALAKIGVFN